MNQELIDLFNSIERRSRKLIITELLPYFGAVIVLCVVPPKILMAQLFTLVGPLITFKPQSEIKIRPISREAEGLLK
jgi:hypothetical protein